MSSTNARSLVRHISMATLLAVAALSLCGCSTTPVAREPLEKSVTYAELHRLMVKLADEPALGTSGSAIAAVPTMSGDLGESAILVSNP